MTRLNAPWTEEQVTWIKRHQQIGEVHPFICSEHSDVPLQVCSAELYCRVPGCGYSQKWVHDFMARPVPRGEDFTLVHGKGVDEKLATDPKAAEAMRDMVAQIRQALDGVATGRFNSVEEAMDSIGAKRLDEGEE